MNQATTLTCPKCGSEMRSYERNGVVVDQCTGCGGLFLDRGELERLAEAETSHYGEQRGDHRLQERHHKKSRKRSFLENLFEGGD